MTRSLSRSHSIEPSVVAKSLLSAPFCHICDRMNLSGGAFKRVGFDIAIRRRCRLGFTRLKSLPFPLKPHSSIFVEYLVNLLDIVVAAIVDPAYFASNAVKTDRNSPNAPFFKIGKTAFEKIWSSDQFNPVLATGPANGRVDAAISIEIPTNEMVEEVIGDLVESGKPNGKGFSRSASQIYQPLTKPFATHMQRNPICCPHDSTIDHSPSFSMSAVNWSCCFYVGLEQAKMSLVFFGKGDREVKTGPITNAAVRIDESKPIRLRLCVDHVEKLMVDRMLPDNRFNQWSAFNPSSLEVIENRGGGNSVFFSSLASRRASDVFVTKRLSLILCQCWASHTT